MIANITYEAGTVNGNKLPLSYDAARNIKQVQEIFAGGVPGRSLFFDYEDVRGEPRIIQITGALGLVIDYEYDEWANLIRATRNGRTELYEYTIDHELDRHNLTAYIDPNENRTEYVYYADGDLFPGEGGSVEAHKYEWVKEAREAAGEPEQAVTGFVYDVTEVSSERWKAIVTDARDNDTEYILNKDGSPTQITEPGGVVTKMEWSVDDITKLKETDALDRVTRFDYDANASLIKETIEAGGAIGDVVTEFEYDDFFNKMTLKRVINTEIQETRFEIDASNGNVESTKDAEDNVTEFYYFGNGDLQSVQGPRAGQSSSFDYDAHGNPSSAIDGEGNVTTTVYDERGRLLSSTDTLGHRTTQAYDPLDRVISVTREDEAGSSDTSTIVRTYFAGGQVRTETNGLGLTTTFTLDDRNRVTSTLDTLGYTTSKTYDGNKRGRVRRHHSFVLWATPRMP